MLDEDFYQILGINNDASTEEITEAYRKLAFQYHPDKNQMSPVAHERMKDINKAYATLSDPTRRKEYDLPRGHAARVPVFKMGSKVRVRLDSASLHKGRTGVVEREPVKDYFRFWYMVKLESRGLATVVRLAEEELEKAGD
jgi:DnaJ-class molecular chaperone